MKFRRILMTSAVVATTGVTLFSCKGKNATEQQAEAPELAVITVEPNMASLETAYPATLHGKNDIEIRPQISGFLTKVCVQEGQHVSKGQTLFTIDQVELRAQVDAARAAINVAQANVNTATTNATNNKMLLDKNIISQSAYQTSVDALNAAKAQLSQAKASYTSAQKMLSYCTVTAPASGVVGTIDYKEGALVSPSTMLTMLSNNSDIEAYFSMNEQEVLELTDNGKRSIQSALAAMPEVSLRLANGDMYEYKGKVISVSGVLDPATGSATAKASFPNPEGMLRSGNTGQVVIPISQNNALLVPQKATYELQDMRFVYVLGDSNKVHSIPITISDKNDGQNFIVTEGLKPGQKIVVEGVGISVKDGMEIKPKIEK